MPKREDMLVMSSDPGVIDAVGLALQVQNAPPNCRSMKEMKAQLQHGAHGIALVDIDAAPRRCLSELEPIITEFDQVRFIVVTSSFDQSLMLEAMQIGARHFMSKNAIANELPPAIERLMKQNGTRRTREHGDLVTVVSAGGGCGCTTLSVNMAHELGILTQSPALAVDLDLNYGVIGTYLGLRSQYGVADVLNSNHEIDPQLISSTALPHSDHLHALLNPAAMQYDMPAQYDMTRLPALVSACRGAYRWCVIDAPRLDLDALQELCFASQWTLIVFQLTVKDIHNARALYDALVKRGAPPQSIAYVVNRYRRSCPMVPLEEAQKAMGDRELILINNNLRPAIDSINFGQPLATSAPRSVVRQDIQKLAGQVMTLSSTATPASGIVHESIK